MREFEHSPEYREAMRRVFDLPPEEQLRALEALRDFLGAAAPAETAVDRQLRERADALLMMRDAARHLGLPDGNAPTAAQFDQAMRALGLDTWTSSRVGRAWVKWSFACDVLRGDRPRLTAAQQAIRRRQRGRARTHEAHLDAIRQWLATDPAMTRMDDYDNWAAEKNDQVGEGDLPVPSAHAIRNSFTFAWQDIIRLARGEIRVEEARSTPRKHSRDWTRAPRRLVSRRGVAELIGIPPGSANATTHRIDFPVPVATIAGQRVWLEEDVLAYMRGDDPPEREEYALQHLYMDTYEIAEALGVKPTSVMNKYFNGPPPAGYAGHRKYWLRVEVEAWLRDNPNGRRRSLAQVRAGNRPPPRAKKTAGTT